jgi:D-alanine-D-alanine ligase
MKIVVVFGGKSVEHEISIISAFQVIEALKTKYEVIPVYISKNNEFYYDKKMNDISYFKTNKNKTKKRNKINFKKKKEYFYFTSNKRKIYFDLIFPIVHGKGSEDGSVLNYFRFNDFPIVGNTYSFYSLVQNKALTKRVLDGLNIDNVDYKLIQRGDNYSLIDFSFPCIVKPNNLGSSLGISVAYNFEELESAINYVFKVDSAVLVEKYLDKSKEYNIAVINNNGVIETSEIEQVEKGDIFTYKDKYLSKNKKKGMASRDSFRYKAKIDNTLKEEIEKISKIIYEVSEASGVIRIDFLYKDKLYVNEINAIPGSYAYYLWQDKYDFLELLDIVIAEARRNNFFFYKSNELIDKNIIFKI